MNNYNPFSLQGKTILITGASSGIGKACAQECAKMGASLVISARNIDRLNETLESLDTTYGQTHQAIICDLTNADDLANLVKTMPKVDGMLVCAGRGVTKPMQFATPELMKSTYEVNLFSQIELIRQVYKTKKIVSGGSIATIVSVGGVVSYNPGNGVYGSAKAAFNSAVKFLALEFAARKIRVNAICPGMIETPLIHGNSISDDQLNEFMALAPMKRFGMPEEVGMLAVFLLSDASKFISGDSIVIDGAASIN